MAFVSVPKDLTKVKNKIILNLTKRQLICFGLQQQWGYRFIFLTRGVIGSSNAATGMCLLMLPAFVFAMYEKDGLPLEKVLKNIMVTVLSGLWYGNIRWKICMRKIEDSQKKGGRERVKKKK